MNPTNGQLLVLAKDPVPGRVKTRLCPPCTPPQAARIAAAALADTLDAVRRTSVGRRVLALDAIHSTMDGFELIRQRGHGLAERIAHAFADTARHCAAPILQLGMDTPQVDPQLLADALGRFRFADAVLGLSEDGGWWALGLRDPAVARALRDVPMSTPDTGQLTTRAIRAAGIQLEFLPRLRDVDTIADARAVAPIIPTSRFAAAVQAVQRQAVQQQAVQQQAVQQQAVQQQAVQQQAVQEAVQVHGVWEEVVRAGAPVEPIRTDEVACTPQ